MITISAKNIVGGYAKDSNILRGIDFDIAQGELLGIIGPNGSGKSTLIKALTGILPYCSGEITIQGKRLYNYTPLGLAQIVAVVPTPSVPLFSFTAREIIAMGRFPHQHDNSVNNKEIIEKAANDTDTTHLLDRNIDSLSAGELQRIIIARALAQQPQILLLDEPTAHLDIGHQLEIFNLLKKLAADGVSIFCVSHDLNLAAEFSSRLLLFSVGQIYTGGTPNEVITEENLAAVYGTLVRVESNPYSGQPFILPSIMDEKDD